MVFEVAHQIGLIPVLAMMGAGRRLPRSYWLVALAFFVSWFADSTQHFIGGTWWAWYFFLPVQIWIVLSAFVEAPVNRLLSAVGLVLLVPLSIAGSGPGPDVLLTFFGSAAILFVARGSLSIPLYIYFGIGSIAYLYMVSQVGSDIFPAWLVYQSCRLLAFIAFLGIILPPVIRRKKGFV